LRSRNPHDLNAEVAECHLSTALCHMANISFRLGKEAGRSEIVKSLSSLPAALEAFESFQEHLLQNGANLSTSPRRLGPWLEMDPNQVQFTGEWAEKANAFLTREYRAPYIVPEQV
jgi:hypothetical protein